jgi:hypothetical protein
MIIGRIGLVPSFKSKLEEKVWAVLKKEFSTVKYEPQRFKFIQPEVERTYIPDFKTGRSNVFIEAKGKLDLETRKKMVWFRDSNPTIRIIFLFMNPDNKITKRSKTTYAMWATDNGFEWLDFRKDWLNAYKQLCRK